MAKRARKTVYAIRKNKDGSISKLSMTGVAWDALAPLKVVTEYGETVTIPKQGLEEVPENYGQDAPAPIKAGRKAS